MSGFPIQPSKVQRPPLRDDVLSRPRLNDQLDAKSGHRVVLLVAEAGYGKTTLLADWTRQTSRRVAWYRLDTDDRDWLTFLHHLVAAGRTVDDQFGSDIEAQLESLGPDGPSREQLVATLARELSAAAADGLTVVLDDYHLVDDKEEVRDILRGLIDRVADGVSFLISTRVEPELALSRYRARAELAHFDATDLRFDEAETERLFREAYQRPLEPDVLVDLAARTEGWAASLQLVRTAIRERTQTEVRAFVRRLSGAGGDLYDYLAEEVVGRLPEDLQQFLMRASLLEWVIPDAMRVVFDDDPARVHTLLERCEALGLLSRRGEDDSPHRFHPLVREFLLARVNAELGEPAVKDLHRRLGATFEGRDWRISATHYAAAGEAEKVWAVIDGSVDQILARGEYLAAAALLEPYTANRSTATTLVVRSRLELQHGRPHEARALAIRAVEAADANDKSSLASALFNASGVHYLTHDKASARSFAQDALRVSANPSQRRLIEASLLLQTVSGAGSMRALLEVLYELAIEQRALRHWHHLGITELNIAILETWMERPDVALVHADLARDLLQATSNEFEAPSAEVITATALAQLGRSRDADKVIQAACTARNTMARVEVLGESARAYLWYGPTVQARPLMATMAEIEDRSFYVCMERANRVWISIEDGDHDELATALEALGGAPVIGAFEGEEFTVQLAIARAAWRLRTPDLPSRLARLDETATLQEAAIETNLVRLLTACTVGPEATARALTEHPSSVAPTILADDVLVHLDGLSEGAFKVVRAQAERFPSKWLASIRRVLEAGDQISVRAVALLEELGQSEDVSLLRAAGKRQKRNSIALAASRRLAQRTAPRLLIEDLGRIRLSLGGIELIGVSVRRKVLALLSYLVTQPQKTATRDQVLDAMWPDFDPATALNSLNQTIYFLRRVIEPKYAASASPEYIHFEGEAVWLDAELVTSESDHCRRLIGQSQGREATQIASILDAYHARFALDFVYEDWAASYRDSLHASFLLAVERAIAQLEDAGHVEDAAAIARRCLDIDPTADQVELRLLRHYRRMGAHAAAAEQYGHYATVLRDELWIEPPALEDI